MELFMSFFELPPSCPSWYSGRLWMLRLGYYKLTMPKEKANDWVWIADHTVQIGEEKCMVILGVRLSSLPEDNKILTHEAVEPLAMYPVTKSNGEVVYEQLEETVEKTGVPRQIISDHGSDLASGIKKFCKEHEETSSIYDIKHKTASVLKKTFEKDESWHNYKTASSESKNKTKQTALSFLSPPNQRSKSRYMNIDKLIDWGGKTLEFLDNKPEQYKENKEGIEEKFGWLRSFRNRLLIWKEIMSLIIAIEMFVREKGLYHGSHLELRKELSNHEIYSEEAKKISSELLAFISEEELKAKRGERLLGSSEVIESVFGKLKRLEQDQAKSGFTGLLLGIGAIVSKTTKEIVEKAMETVSTEKVHRWLKEKLGKSVQAKRMEVFSSNKNKEQKQTQKRMVA
jgi:hypothetical protein